MNLELLQEDVKTATISELAYLVMDNWKLIAVPAFPYLQAMTSLNDISEDYYNDSGKSIVLYFLSNATGWRGEVARVIKAELNNRVKGK